MRCLATACMVWLLAGMASAAESPVVEHFDSANAWINWERQVVKAVGVGVLPGDTSSPEEAERLARQSAGINAYRNLESAISMVRIHGEILVGNLVPEVPEIRLKQLAHSATIVSDRQQCDRSFEVILQVPLAGVRALLTPMTPERHGGRSLQIDARGLDVLPALSPKILDEAGNEVYSGIALYSACGDTCAPGVVKALGVSGLTDLIIKNFDAEKIRQADALTILLSPARGSGKGP